MLKFFTRLEKTRNFVILIFGVLMVASLVFWGGSGIQSSATVDPSRSTETAASVSGEDITVGELYRQKEMYSRFSQGRPYPAKLLLDGMIASRMTRVEAPPWFDCVERGSCREDTRGFQAAGWQAFRSKGL